MRITNQMMTQRIITNLEDSRSRLADLQTRAATQKLVNTPSDDPARAVDSLSLRSTLRTNEAYLSTAGETADWLNANEEALGQLINLGSRALDLARQGQSDTLSAREREALAIEVDAQLQDAASTGNASQRGNFIFAGTQTTTRPFVYNPATGAVDRMAVTGGQIQHSIAPGVFVKVNLDGNALLRPVFETMANIRDILRQPGQPGLAAARAAMDTAVKNLSDVRTANGARQRNLTDSVSRMQANLNSLKSLLSEKEDANMAETAMLLKQQETVYQTVINVAGRVLQPSLFESLR